MSALSSQVWTLAQQPGVDQRDRLAQFWLHAPSDQLESLWNSGFGELTVGLVQGLKPDTNFHPDQVAVRDSINALLQQHGLQHPCTAQWLLAVFLYSPPGLMQIQQPEQQLPAWIVSVYRRIYEQQSLGDHVQAVQERVSPSAAPGSVAPDFGVFPGSLQELIGNRIHLNRILGLSNLYYIDPEDREVFEELRQVRAQLADLIFAAPEANLQAIWASDFGDRYWALVRSGVQNEPLDPSDEQRKQRVVQALAPEQGGGFDKPGSINAVLVAMIYFQPGSMQVARPEQNLPAWLLENYQQIFAQAIPLS